MLHDGGYVRLSGDNFRHKLTQMSPLRFRWPLSGQDRFCLIATKRTAREHHQHPSTKLVDFLAGQARYIAAVIPYLRRVTAHSRSHEIALAEAGVGTRNATLRDRQTRESQGRTPRAIKLHWVIALGNRIG